MKASNWGLFGPSSRSDPRAAAHAASHLGLRVALVALETLLAVTTIWGAIFVVPTIPKAWLHQGTIAPFADYTIPAFVLGILCGGSALVALVCVLAAPQLGALASIVAGVFMVGFELVEIAVVGFTAVMDPAQPVAWLQVFYLTIGAATAFLGAFLWRAETGSFRLAGVRWTSR